ncbi:MAG: hypothetical protein NTW86_24355 [Candidatus Sumerlaeota bacterium]|nr:hypothetical protein [Candidatus Sumerlaeota bacterium]
MRASDGAKLRRCSAEPLPGSHRVGCNVADGFHCPSNRKGPLLENCRFLRVNDDCVNIYSKCHAVAKCLGPQQVVLDLPAGARSLGLSTGASRYRPGDTVGFVNPNNGDVEAVARVAGVETADWRGKPHVALRLDRPAGGLLSRDELGKPPVTGREYLWGQKTGPVEHFAVNLSTKGDGSVIAGCLFGHNRASGLKIKTSNGVIENNRVESEPQGSCLLLLCELRWMEGWIPRNLVIRGNTFDHARVLTTHYQLPYDGRPASRMIRRVSIEDNVFAHASEFAIRLNNACDVQVVRNRIQSARPVTIDNCDHVRIADNVFEMPAGAESPVALGPKADKGSIEIQNNITGDEKRSASLK